MLRSLNMFLFLIALFKKLFFAIKTDCPNFNPPFKVSFPFRNSQRYSGDCFTPGGTNCLSFPLWSNLPAALGQSCWGPWLGPFFPRSHLQLGHDKTQRQEHEQHLQFNRHVSRGHLEEWQGGSPQAASLVNLDDGCKSLPAKLRKIYLGT